MSRRSAPLLAALLLAMPALAGEPAPAAAKPELPPNMESYQLVLLVRGSRWTPEVTPATAELQKQHIAHLTRMGEQGKIVVAGPFSDQRDVTMRGACVYRVGSVEEARALAEQDPAVKAGRLRVEVVTWWVEKGYMTFPKAPPAESPLAP
jgi:uncharacterized protein YciI